MSVRIEAVRLAAFLAVSQEKSPDYRLRQIHRWYSREFYTPLHVVEEMDLDKVLQAWFEVHFETLKGGDAEGWLKERNDLILTDAQREEKDRERDREKADADSFAHDTEVRAKLNKEAAARAAADLAKAAEKMKLSLKDLPDRIAMRFPEPDEDPLLVAMGRPKPES